MMIVALAPQPQAVIVGHSVVSAGSIQTWISRRCDVDDDTTGVTHEGRPRLNSSSTFLLRGASLNLTFRSLSFSCPCDPHQVVESDVYVRD